RVRIGSRTLLALPRDGLDLLADRAQAIGELAVLLHVPDFGPQAVELRAVGAERRLRLCRWKQGNKPGAWAPLRLKFLRSGIGIPRAREESVERVVILLGEWVE